MSAFDIYYIFMSRRKKTFLRCPFSYAYFNNYTHLVYVFQNVYTPYDYIQVFVLIRVIPTMYVIYNIHMQLERNKRKKHRPSSYTVGIRLTSW